MAANVRELFFHTTLPEASPPSKPSPPKTVLMRRKQIPKILLPSTSHSICLNRAHLKPTHAGKQPRGSADKKLLRKKPKPQNMNLLSGLPRLDHLKH
jgi:hypothetical protein